MRSFEIYTPQRLCAAQACVRRSAAAMVVSIAVGVLLCAAGIALRQEWLCVGGLIAGIWAAYYWMDAHLRPALAERAFAKHMLAVLPGKMIVDWGGAAPEWVYVEGVQAWEIRCRKDGAVRTFYLRAEDAVPEIAEGTPVEIESVDRFIVRIAPAE